MGFRQLHNLGRYLRRDYGEWVGSYNHSQVEVYSTDYRRTVESAQAFLTGVFPEGGPDLPQNIDQKYLFPPYNASQATQDGTSEPALPGSYQPIPVQDGSAILEDCDNYLYWEELMIAENLQTYENITLSYMPLILRMRQLFGLRDSELTLVGMSKLYDTLLCDKYLGKGLPPGMSEPDYLNLQHLHYYLYMLIHSGTYTRIISTPLFERILLGLDSAIETAGPTRMTVLSGHDTNICPTLSFLNLSSFQCIEDLYQGRPLDKYLNCENGPGFAANIVIELWA